MTRTACTRITNTFWEDLVGHYWLYQIVVNSDFGREIACRLPRDVRRVGITGYHFLPAWVLEAIKDSHPGASVLVATELLQSVAQIKSDQEIDLLRRCTEMTDKVGQALSGQRAIRHQ